MKKVSLNKLSSTQKVVLLFAVLMVFSVDALFAQAGNGVTGLNAGVTEIKRYVVPVTNGVMAIGGVIGLIGGYMVYQKHNAGEPDAAKATIAWIGSLIFLIIVPLIVKGFFG